MMNESNRPIDVAAWIEKRDSICRSLQFLSYELQDGDDPLFLAHAAMVLQITASLNLASPEYAREMMDAINVVAKREFGL